MAYAFYDNFYQPLGLGIVHLTEPQRVERGYRPCAHRKNIPVNTTHTRCRTLERLNGGRMVVRLYLKHAAPAIAYIYQASIFFPRFYQQFSAITRQGFEPFYTVFIAAMFAPHYGVHGGLRKIGRTSQYLFYFFKFFFAKAQFYGLFECGDHGANVEFSINGSMKFENVEM